MASAPTPNHPLRLPSNWFATPCPVSNSSFPPLRLTFRPHILIPTPLVSSQVLGRSKLEECLHVIVPVGGKVEVVLTVDQEGLGEQGDGIDVKALIGTCFRAVFQHNSSTLALIPLEPLLIPHPDNHKLILKPLTSLPSHTYLKSHLLPSTHPVAYLTRIEVHCSWPLPRRAITDVAGEDQGAIARTQQDEDIAGDQDHEETFSWDDDEGQEAPAYVQEEDDEMILWDGDQEDARIAALPSILLDPQQALHAQIRQAITRVIREQLIRRFSLIFDGGLLKYSRTLAPPTALPLALTRFLTLAMVHKTPLANTAKPLIKSIKSNQYKMLSDRVEQAVNLPTRKNKRKRQEQVEDVSESQQPSQPSPKQDSRSKSNRRQEKTEALAEDLTPEERAVAFIAWQKQNTQEQEGEGIHGDEKKMRRVVGEAMAHIGHVNFERKRKRGRLRYGAIKLSFNDSNIADSSAPASDNYSLQHHDGAVPSTPLAGKSIASDLPSDDQELILDYFDHDCIHFENEDDLLFDDDEDGQMEVELDDCDDLILDDEEEDDSQVAYEGDGSGAKVSASYFPLDHHRMLCRHKKQTSSHQYPTLPLLPVDPTDTMLSKMTNEMQVTTYVSLEGHHGLAEDDDLILYDEFEEVK